MRASTALSLWVLVVLTGCATTAQFRSNMDDFLNKPIAEAREALGYDFATRELEDGKTAYTWIRVETGVSPGHQTPTVVETLRTRDDVIGTRTTTIFPGTYYPPYAYRNTCEITLITDPSGTVVRWHARGEACKGRPVNVLRSEP